MFAKLSVLILAVAGTALGLLSLRHSTLTVANELASAQLRIQRHDQDLWTVRSKIAQLVTPEHVGAMMADAGKFHPLIMPDETTTTGDLPLALNSDEGGRVLADNIVKPKAGADVRSASRLGNRSAEKPRSLRE